MKKMLLVLLTGLFVFGLVGVSGATTVTSLYGDKDTMGIEGLTEGSWFDWGAVNSDAGDAGTITDTWMYGDKSWTHSYDLTGLGALTAATLTIATGGQGWYGLTQIYIDNQLIGTLTQGDSPANYYHVDTFDLLGLASFDGASTLSTVHYLQGDGWALDYSELKLSDASVPEPSTLLLMSAGIGGVLFCRKRVKKG